MIPVILSGGSGSRLWPTSRQSFPKQFCDLLDEALFDKAIKRVTSLGVPWAVTVRELKTLTERSLKNLGIPSHQVILEPFGRNTAPAIALLCKRFEIMGWKDEVVGIFPADHLIQEGESFLACVREAERLAKQNEIVTLGIRPTKPSTGYGYIQTDGPLENGASQGVVAFRSSGFREKPDRATAEQFLASGNFYWNAGIFFFRVGRMIELLKLHVSDLWQSMDQLKGDGSNLDQIYREVKPISIDFAVMERLPSHACIPCSFDWTDLGSWDSVVELLEGRATESTRGIQIDGERNFVFPLPEKIYSFLGVDDLIVVDTPDALLVTRKGHSEGVREVVETLKKAGHPSSTQHRFEVRPWGRFEILREAPDFKAKAITVDPEAQISYQSHDHRSEIWIVVRGDGEVRLNDQVIPVRTGSFIHIPAKSKHRIRNTGAIPLEFVEVQTGSYFGEDDIVRYADDYGRSGSEE